MVDVVICCKSSSEEDEEEEGNADKKLRLAILEGWKPPPSCENKNGPTGEGEEAVVHADGDSDVFLDAAEEFEDDSQVPEATDQADDAGPASPGLFCGIYLVSVDSEGEEPWRVQSREDVKTAKRQYERILEHLLGAKDWARAADPRRRADCAQTGKRRSRGKKKRRNKNRNQDEADGATEGVDQGAVENPAGEAENLEAQVEDLEVEVEDLGKAVGMENQVLPKEPTVFEDPVGKAEDLEGKVKEIEEGKVGGGKDRASPEKSTVEDPAGKAEDLKDQVDEHEGSGQEKVEDAKGQASPEEAEVGSGNDVQGGKKSKKNKKRGKKNKPQSTEVKEEEKTPRAESESLELGGESILARLPAVLNRLFLVRLSGVHFPADCFRRGRGS